MTNDAEQRYTNHLTGAAAVEGMEQRHSSKAEGSNSIPTPEGAPRKSSTGRSVVMLLIAVIVVGLLVISGIVPRLR
jgi:cell division septal protein FtsQ